MSQFEQLPREQYDKPLALELRLKDGKTTNVIIAGSYARATEYLIPSQDPRARAAEGEINKVSIRDVQSHVAVTLESVQPYFKADVYTAALARATETDKYSPKAYNMGIPAQAPINQTSLEAAATSPPSRMLL